MISLARGVNLHGREGVKKARFFFYRMGRCGSISQNEKQPGGGKDCGEAEVGIVRIWEERGKIFLKILGGGG